MDEHMPVIPKAGDIKVNSTELIELLECLEYYQQLVFNNLEVLNEEEKEKIQDYYDTSCRFINKYIVISDLRRREHLWFLLLKKIDNKDYKEISNTKIDYNIEISEHIALMKSIFKEAQELPSMIDSLLPLTIISFGAENTRREVWAEYLSVKSEREAFLKLLNKNT